MILIIGGSSQGKTEFAAAMNGAGSLAEFRNSAADGRTDSAELAFERSVVLQFHQYIYRMLEQNQDPMAFTQTLIKQKPELIIMNEVGAGIVPIEKKERLYREAAGRAGQLLAAEADEVYRVVCGIGTRIK